MAISAWRVRLPQSGNWSYASDHRYEVEFQVETTDDLDTAFAVLSDATCPAKLGGPFTGWAYNPATDVYTARTPADDPNSVCVLVTPRRDQRHPRVWALTASYEGVTDPTAELPGVTFEPVPYQEQVVVDVRGQAVTNSAIEAFDDGLTVDRNRRRLTVVRNLPYSGWDPTVSDQYENTLNLKPYVYGTLTGPPTTDPTSGAVTPGAPLAAPPGKVKCLTLTAERMERLKVPVGVTPAAQFYWRLRAVLEIDTSTFVDNNLQRQPTNWRKVVVDAGHHERDRNGRLQDVYAGSAGSRGPALLDGLGRKLPMPTEWPVTTAPASGSYVLLALAPVPGGAIAAGAAVAAATPNHVLYATFVGTPLTVAAPGLLANTANAYNADGSPGTIATDNAGGMAGGDTYRGGTLAAVSGGGGGFTYTPPSGSTPQWDWFGFSVSTTAGTSAYATCLILVGPRPRVRVFDLYESKDWTPIAALIGGW